jgi:hypothetical protein
MEGGRSAMANASDIREHLAQLLSEQISLDDFEDWFVPYSWNIHKQGDEASQRFAYAIEHALSRFSQDSGELRDRLSELLSASEKNDRLTAEKSIH